MNLHFCIVPDTFVNLKNTRYYFVVGAKSGGLQNSPHPVSCSPGKLFPYFYIRYFSRMIPGGRSCQLRRFLLFLREQRFLEQNQRQFK